MIKTFSAMHMAKIWPLLASLFAFWVLGTSHALAYVTLLIPAKPDMSVTAPQEKNIPTKEAPKASAKQKASKNQGAEPAKAKEAQKDTAQKEVPPKEAASPLATLPTIDEETDVLITMMDPFRHKGLAMDMPQSFAVLRYDHTSPLKDGRLTPERRDLLGDVEEILYLGQKAWGANVGLVYPGLYQFVMETRPWWHQQKEKFLQHYVKVMVPVYEEEAGWYEPTGQRFEIVPTTRPFGLLAPALMTGIVLLDGRPLPHTQVVLQRVNTDSQKVPTSWHESTVVRTDANGAFSVLPGRSGWWCLMATVDGAPRIGPDGQSKALELGALFWFYVDGASASTRP